MPEHLRIPTMTGSGFLRSSAGENLKQDIRFLYNELNLSSNYVHTCGMCLNVLFNERIIFVTANPQMLNTNALNGVER